MKLILHCGLNKAGSTYLQNMFVLSSTELNSHGVHYPEPYDSGIGNAGIFSLALKALDKKKANLIFRQFHEDAKRRNCDVLFLSSEYLFFQIINREQRNLFLEIIESYEISDVKLVVVFRPIVEHAISAYSHRCGTIRLPQFEDWIRGDLGPYPSNSFRTELVRKSKFWYNRYEFWDSSAKLLEVIDANNFNIVPIQYSMNLKSDFDDLLGVNLIAPETGKINKSMTLYQAELCRIIFEKDKTWARRIRAFFKNNQSVRSPDDSFLRQTYKKAVLQAIDDNLDVIKCLEEKLGVSLYPAEHYTEKERDVVQGENRSEVILSNYEIECMFEILINNKSSTSSLRVFIRKLKSYFRANGSQ